MVNYDDDFLDDVAKNVDLLKYAESQGFVFEKSGKEYFTSCPLHKDVTPSLNISETTSADGESEHQKWYCFSCHKGGGIFSWLIHIEGLTPEKAAEKAIELAGLDLAKLQISPVARYFRTVKKLNAKKPVIHHEQLKENILDGFTREHIDEWCEEGISLDTLDTFGIKYDPKTNRIIYPVRDINGRLINIKGRARGDYKKRRIPKYMNYRKIVDLDYLQSLDITKDYAKSENELILFESIKSVMKAWDWGIRNTAACETSTLTDGQIKEILRLGVANVVICFDKDVKFYDQKSRGLREQLDKLKRFVNLYVVRDNNGLLVGEKDSPADCGESVFRELYSKKQRWR